MMAASRIPVDPPSAEILRRMARGEGWEDVVVALRKRGATYEKGYIRRFVLRLPKQRRER